MASSDYVEFPSSKLCVEFVNKNVKHTTPPPGSRAVVMRNILDLNPDIQITKKYRGEIPGEKDRGVLVGFDFRVGKKIVHCYGAADTLPRALDSVYVDLFHTLFKYLPQTVMVRTLCPPG